MIGIYKGGYKPTKVHRQSMPPEPTTDLRGRQQKSYGDTDCGKPANRLKDLIDISEVAPDMLCARCWPDGHEVP